VVDTFPIKIFIDVEPESFKTGNKKHVTEDFVAENFKRIKWNVFRPFNDTGIDLIITKQVCSKNFLHTKYNENLTTNCEICGEHSITIKRFIQVKTREVKQNIIGYTFSTKDFSTDPRNILFLYSDHTNDFFSLSIYDYLNFFYENNFASRFTLYFNTPDDKRNTLRMKTDDNSWSYLGKSWEKFRNILGVENFQHRDFDINLKKYSKIIKDLKNKMFYTFRPCKPFENLTAIQIESIQNKINSDYLKKDKNEYLELVNLYVNKMNSLDKNIKNSAIKYLEHCKELYGRFKS